MLPLVELMGLGCGVESVGPELSLAFLPHWTLPFLTLCRAEDRATPGTAGRPLVFWLQLGLSTFSPHKPLSPQTEVVFTESCDDTVYLFTCSEVQMCF